MAFFRCWHKWGFPRRWLEFGGNRDVDVQTCSRCGARRESRVQFGKATCAPEATKPERQCAEVTA